MNGLSLSLWPASQRGGWSPSALFSGGAQGFWLDPSSIGSLSQDSAGSTPVTAAGQSVGLARDLSGRGNNAAQATALARPVYQVASGRPYLAFDGVDDWLGVGSIAMGASGRTIIAALTKRSDAALGAVVEHRPMWTTTSGGVAIFAPGTAAAATYGARWLTSTVQSNFNSPASYAAPNTAVVSAVAMTGDHDLRVNGAQVATNAPAGVMAGLTAAMSVGARDGTSLFAAMDLYGLIVIDRALSGGELSQAEAWAASKAGVTL